MKGGCVYLLGIRSEMMRLLITGERIQVPDSMLSSQLEVEVQLQSQQLIDIACFGLDDQRKLSDDRYMIFYNQTKSPGNEICLQGANNQAVSFVISLAKMAPTVHNLVFTATIDGEGTMSEILPSYIRFKTQGQILFSYEFTGNDFKNEKTIILSEIYYKNMWRINAVGKGFNGGLGVLLEHFGGEVSADSVSNQGDSVKKIELEKKLEKQAPRLLNLAKKAKISLQKVGLQNHDAKVALCLDISGSMSSLYKKGKIQEFAERILALATRFDDDGAIDIFLFGQNAHNVGELTVDNFSGFVDRMNTKYPLEGGTYYSKGMKLIREHYFKEAPSRKTPFPQALPVYVMFITDGATSDENKTRAQIKDSSYEPIFWQFMAIGKSKKDRKKRKELDISQLWARTSFTFLEELDEMEGRFIDNANFFSVEDPAQIADDELYDLLLEEYPGWVKKAVQNKVLVK
jgi:stress response protein SCP2